MNINNLLELQNSESDFTLILLNIKCLILGFNKSCFSFLLIFFLISKIFIDRSSSSQFLIIFTNKLHQFNNETKVFFYLY